MENLNDLSRSVKAISQNVSVIHDSAGEDLKGVLHSVADLDDISTNEIRKCWHDNNEITNDFLEEAICDHEQQIHSRRITIPYYLLSALSLLISLFPHFSKTKLDIAGH